MSDETVPVVGANPAWNDKPHKGQDYDLKSFGAKIRTKLAEFDLDGDGDVDVDEVAAAIEAMIKTESNLKKTRTVAYGLAVAVVVIVLANFALAFAVAHMSKDVNVRGNVMMSKETGDPVQVASTDLKVEGGLLIANRPSSGDAEANSTRRRLSEDGSQAEPLATSTHLYVFDGEPADLFAADDSALTTLQFMEMQNGEQLLSLKYKSHDRVAVNFYPGDEEFQEIMAEFTTDTEASALPSRMRVSALKIWTFHPEWELIVLSQLTFSFESESEVGLGSVMVDLVHTTEVEDWAFPATSEAQEGSGQRRRLQACCGINGLKKKINGLKNDVNNLKDDVNDLKDDVSDLKSDLSDALSDLNSAKNWVVNKATSISSILNSVISKLSNILDSAKVAEAKAEVKNILTDEILGTITGSGEILAELMNDAIKSAADFECPLCIPFQTLVDKAGSSDIKLDYSAMSPMEGLSIKLEPTACVEIKQLEVAADGLNTLANKIADRLLDVVNDLLDELWVPVTDLLDAIEKTAEDAVDLVDDAQDTVDDLDNTFGRRRRLLAAAADDALAGALTEVRQAVRDATFRRLRGIEDHGSPKSEVEALVHRLHDTVYPHIYMGYQKHSEAVLKEHIDELRASAATRAAGNSTMMAEAARRHLQGTLGNAIEGMGDIFDDISSTSSPIQLSEFKIEVSFQFRMKMQFTAASSVNLDLDMMQNVEPLSVEKMIKTPIPGVQLKTGFKVEPALMLKYKAEAALYSELVVVWENTGVVVDAIAGTVTPTIGGFGDDTGTTVTGYGKGGGVIFSKLKLWVTTGLCMGDSCLDAVHYADETVNVGFDWGACIGSGCAAMTRSGEDLWPMFHHSTTAAGGPRGTATGPSDPVGYSSGSGPGSCFPDTSATEAAVTAAQGAASTALTALGIDANDDNVREVALCMTATQPPSGEAAGSGVIYAGAGAWAWVASPVVNGELKLVMPAGLCSSSSSGTDSSLIQWDYPVPVPSDGTLFYANLFETCTEFDVASWASRALSGL